MGLAGVDDGRRDQGRYEDPDLEVTVIAVIDRRRQVQATVEPLPLGADLIGRQLLGLIGRHEAGVSGGDVVVAAALEARRHTTIDVPVFCQFPRRIELGSELRPGTRRR
ncbi:hypothetical protein D3C71_1726960 [compost metagenome]